MYQHQLFIYNLDILFPDQVESIIKNQCYLIPPTYVDLIKTSGDTATFAATWHLTEPLSTHVKNIITNCGQPVENFKVTDADGNVIITDHE